MFYKMIYFSSHKFAFLNLRFLTFLRTFSSITRKICVQTKNKVHHVNQLIEPDLMMYIHITFSKKTTPPTPHTPLTLLHWTIQNILLAPNPFHCFFAKSLWAGKKSKWKLRDLFFCFLCFVVVMLSFFGGPITSPTPSCNGPPHALHNSEWII